MPGGTDAAERKLSTRYLAVAALAAFLAWGERAYAQGELELDLTDTKKDEPKKDDLGLDLTTPAEKPKPPPGFGEAKKPLVKKSDAPAVERDITQDDRVKSVQRKLYTKRGRFELAPSVMLNVNDPYYTKFGGAIRLAFYPRDTLAFSARFTLMQTIPTDDVRTAKKNLQARIFYSVPHWSALADVEWSPFYGKVAFFNSILHFDGYLIAGGGVVYTEMSAAPDHSINPAFDLGFGLRFVAKDFLAVNLGLVNTTYVEQPAGTTKGTTNNLMMLHAGVSIFFPFKSTFREAE